MARRELAEQDDRSHATLVHHAVQGTAEALAEFNLFSRLLIEHVGLVSRTADGRLMGRGHYVVFYCPLEDWTDASTNTVIGEWLYGEWSDRQIDKPLDTGALVSGSRVILAMGSARRVGNGTDIALSNLAVGLIEERAGRTASVHFVGAVRMSGLREITSPCPEADFFSAVTGFIAKHGDRAVPGFYPLKRGARP